MKNNKYRLEPEKTIDLHGLTTSEVTSLLNELRATSRGVLVRIIVGRGTRSMNGPVLPEHVKRYLTSANISYKQSKIQEGGEGALEAWF